MKLTVRFAVLVSVLFLATVGAVWFLMASRLGSAGRQIDSLSAQIDALEKKEAELRTELSSFSAGIGASEAATKAAGVLTSFVAGRSAEIGDADLLARFAGASDAQSGAARELLKANSSLDQVIVTDASGVVIAAEPANESLLGQSFLSADEAEAYRKVKEARWRFKVSDKGDAQLLTVGMPAWTRIGGRKSLAGIVIEVAALESILKTVAGSVAAKTETRFLVLGKNGEIVFAPAADLVGKTNKDLPELKVLADTAEGQLIEISHDQRRWMGVWKTVPLPSALNLTVVGLGAIGAPPAGATARPGGAPSAPYLILGAVTALGLTLALLSILLPLGRLGGLAKSAQALASGAASVEFKSAGAKDEIGEAARALAKVGEQLAVERAHREETSQAYATLQRDLQRVQSENRELQEYQRNLETKSRQQQAALEGEVASARSELEAARAEIETVRAQLTQAQASVAARDAAVAARDAAIVERDAALVQAGSQLQSLTESLAALQQSVESLSGRLAEANTELERRKSAPATAFGLFAEASDALSVELAGLIELVQGYISQLVEAGAITEEQQQFLSTVITRSARSQRLMGDLRDFSNIVRPDGLAREPLNLAELLADVVSAAQEGAEARGITLDADVPAALPEAMGDESRLRQLFTVLLQNATRFTPEGGTVTVRVGMRESVVGVRIEDSAESVPVKSDEVFDHFHPADEEILALRGSGLRFPVLRAIAGAHGGAIDLAITEQGSNLFFVRIPVRAEAPTADQTAALFAGVSTGEAAAAPAAEPEALEATPAETDLGVSASAETPQPVSAEAAAFAEQFAAFAAGGTPPAPAAEPALEAAPAEAPAGEVSADAAAFAEQFAAFAAGGASPSAAPAPPVETTESILAAPAEPSAGEAPAEPLASGMLDELWTVPDAGAPPTIEGLEGAAGVADATPGVSPDLETPQAPPSGDQAAAGGDQGKPFSFGSDEILQE